MISLADPVWQTLKGGYRVPFDASVRLRELDAGSDNFTEIWEELWNELQHQGDVDMASYAAVPHLVQISIKRELLDWNIFALVATIEDYRIFGDNPEIPEWLAADYHGAIKLLAEFGAKHFADKNWSKEMLQSFLAVAAFARGAHNTGRVLIEFSDEEMEDALEKLFE